MYISSLQRNAWGNFKLKWMFELVSASGRMCFVSCVGLAWSVVLVVIDGSAKALVAPVNIYHQVLCACMFETCCSIFNYAHIVCLSPVQHQQFSVCTILRALMRSWHKRDKLPGKKPICLVSSLHFSAHEASTRFYLFLFPTNSLAYHAYVSCSEVFCFWVSDFYLTICLKMSHTPFGPKWHVSV